MSKYEPLEHFLHDAAGTEVPLSFREIEKIIGAPLPPAARNHRAWWSNNASNNVMTRSWLAAGFESERVDMGSQTLVFRRRMAAPSVKAQGRPSQRRLGVVDDLRSRLGGTVTIPSGSDVSAPTGDHWDAGH